MYLFHRLNRLLRWLGVRLVIAMVAAVSASGFGLLAVPPAHAGLTEPASFELIHDALSPLPSW